MIINRTSSRQTVEDKSSSPPEIYKEVVVQELRIFGIRVLRTEDTYICEERPTSNKSGAIGFKNK